MLSEDDVLGAALGERLHELVADIHPSPALLMRLEAEIAPSRAHGRLPSPRRWRLLALPLPAAALAAAVLIAVGGSTAVPSIAVAVESSGAVYVTINKVTGVGPANAELRSQGMRSVVVVPMSPSCPDHVGMSYMATDKHPAPTIGLTRHRLPAGVRVIIAALQIGPNKIELAFGRIHGAPPACVSSRGSGPGLGDWKPSRADKVG